MAENGETSIDMTDKKYTYVDRNDYLTLFDDVDADYNHTKRGKVLRFFFEFSRGFRNTVMFYVNYHTIINFLLIFFAICMILYFMVKVVMIRDWQYIASLLNTYKNYFVKFSFGIVFLVVMVLFDNKYDFPLFR
jgi:hypothetical protein